MGAHALVQIHDAAARANAGVWLRPGAHPGSLGEHNARNAPCTKPAVCPAQWRTAGPARSHRLRSARNATRRPSGAGRCGAVVPGDRVWWRSSAKGAQELHRLRMGHGLRRHPRHCGTGLLRPTGDRRYAHRPQSTVRIGTGPLRHPLALGRHDGATRRSTRARGRAVGCFTDKKPG